MGTHNQEQGANTGEDLLHQLEHEMYNETCSSTKQHAMPYDQHSDEAFVSATPAQFGVFAERIDALAKQIEHAVRPKGRTMRLFRPHEVCELTGLTPAQLRGWRVRNKGALEAYNGSVKAPTSQAPTTLFTLGDIHRCMEDAEIRPRRPEGSRAMRLGVFGLKGGSTKSTTTLHLAMYAAIQGWRTLVIDADPQASLSALLNVNVADVDAGETLAAAYESVVSQDLFDRVGLVPRKTHVDGLDIVPASLDMIGSDFEITSYFLQRNAAVQQYYKVVSRAISAVEDDYDLILLDGAPAFSFSALALLWAVDGLIVPMPPSAPDFKATGTFFALAGQTLTLLNNRAGRPDRVWAPLLVLHNRVKRGAASDEIRKASAEAFGMAKIEDVIPDLAAVPNALAMSMSVYETTAGDLDSNGLRAARLAYDELGRRVMGSVRTAWLNGIAREGSEP